MVALTILSASAAVAETENFDQDKVGTPRLVGPAACTGTGSPRWAVEAEPVCAERAERVAAVRAQGPFPGA
jgi:hypothetical protein